MCHRLVRRRPKLWFAALRDRDRHSDEPIE
jgi:hypothetical protein